MCIHTHTHTHTHTVCSTYSFWSMILAFQRVSSPQILRGELPFENPGEHVYSACQEAIRVSGTCRFINFFPAARHLHIT
jgi:hypothetical protein